MEMALQEEAELHRSESQRLNEELYLQEKRQCDWYVEKHTLQQQMGGMQQELAQRDELDSEIESKVRVRVRVRIRVRVRAAAARGWPSPRRSTRAAS